MALLCIFQGPAPPQLCHQQLAPHLGPLTQSRHPDKAIIATSNDLDYLLTSLSVACLPPAMCVHGGWDPLIRCPPHTALHAASPQ